jgi:hypothetical protein
MFSETSDEPLHRCEGYRSPRRGTLGRYPYNVLFDGEDGVRPAAYCLDRLSDERIENSARI